jgi:hypothetical protein
MNQAVPLSPELVLVSPELRELALRQLDLPYERNGGTTRPRAARAEAVDEPSFLRVTALAAVRSAALAGALFGSVAAAAVGLTVAPDETEPRLAEDVTTSSPPLGRPWRAPPKQGIGQAADSSLPLREAPLAWSLEALPRPSGSVLSPKRRNDAPVLRGDAVPLLVRSTYISCGPRRWIATGANWTLFCAPEQKRRR